MAKTANNRKGLLKLWWLIVLGPVVGMLFMLVLAANSRLPDISQLENPRSDLATAILFSDGSLMGQYYRENRIPVKYEHISPHVVNALIATEDERFREHSGIDLRGSMRAAVFLGKRGGASTITQQLAKMQFTEKPANNVIARTWQKLKEWVISAQLERLYTKEEIIALYLNRFDWINQAVGINSAAHVYFNTPPDSLRIEQAAMLVGMLKNPALFNPARPTRVDTVMHRRMVVLDQMRKNGSITDQAYDSLKALPLGLRFQRVDHTEGPAPYFREVLRGQLQELLNRRDPKTGELLIGKLNDEGEKVPYDIYTDGLRIYTTLDKRMQQSAEWAVREHLSTELQPEFEKDLGKKKNRPFAWNVNQDEIDGIMDAAMKRSSRYKNLTGKRCPTCERPAQYIEQAKKDGVSYWHCMPDKGGCDTWWPVVAEKDIPAIFEKPVKMRVFSWRGEIDTVMSPIDSIRYYKGFLQSGLLSMNPHTGFVKAWVGGVDYKNFQYDHVAQAKRQVGSTFKPFVYATAIREGLQPCLELPNQKTCFDMPAGQPEWCPKNSDEVYGGMVSMQYALANSINTITAWLMKQYSPEAVTVLAKNMGVKSELVPVPSLCLGVCDLTLEEITAAFASFANQGVYIEPIAFTRIEDKNGNAIFDVVPKTEEALDERTAYIMLDMLKHVVDGAWNREKGKTVGTGMRLRMTWGKRGKYGGIKYPTAGKTGTTQNNSDGWFIGITPDLVTGVWTGAEDRSVHFNSTDLGQGANMALPIYGYYMNKVYEDPTIDISKGDFPKPQGDLGVELDCRNGAKDGGVDFNEQGEESWE